MALNENQRLQEFVLVAGDKVSLVDRKWWYALLLTIVSIVPLYLLAKSVFIRIAISRYTIPQIIHTSALKQPLQITEKGIFDLGNQNYSAYVRIKNIEYDWGVAQQNYTAEFKTLGGTSITKVVASTFVLPSKEKLLVFSKFNAAQKPQEFIFNLDETHFVHKPTLEFNYELERLKITNSPNLVVSAGIKNTTPFIVKQVNLPIAIFNAKNEIIAVNFTNINDLLSGETRTFQYSWPLSVPGAVRAEISPEVNIFDRNVFQLESEKPTF